MKFCFGLTVISGCERASRCACHLDARFFDEHTRDKPTRHPLITTCQVHGHLLVHAALDLTAACSGPSSLGRLPHPAAHTSLCPLWAFCPADAGRSPMTACDRSPPRSASDTSGHLVLQSPRRLVVIAALPACAAANHSGLVPERRIQTPDNRHQTPCFNGAATS